MILCALLILSVVGCSRSEGESPELKFAKISAHVETNGALEVTDSREISQCMSTNFAWEISLPNKIATINIGTINLLQDDNLQANGANAVVPLERISYSEVELPKQDVENSEDVEKAIKEQKNNIENAISTNIGWAFDKYQSKIYFHLPESCKGKKVDIIINYNIEDAIQVYDDLAELSWYYLPGNNHAGAEAIECEVSLPVNGTQQGTIGENLFGWGHSQNGVVDYKGFGNYEFTSQNISANRDCMAHILFPKSWISSSENNPKIFQNGARKDSVVSSEKDFADRQTSVKSNDLKLDIIILAFLCVILVISSFSYAFQIHKFKKVLTLDEHEEENSQIALEKQSQYDKKSRKVLKFFIFNIVICFIAILTCIFLIPLPICVIFACLVALVNIIFANYCPFIFTNLRDIIKD